MTKQDLINIHQWLTALNDYIRINGLPESTETDEVKSITEVQVIIENLIENEKQRQRIING
jgi:hypothetical protein